jgi:hypothetical protein
MVANSLVDTLEDAARVHIEESYNDNPSELLHDDYRAIYWELVDVFGERPVAWIPGQFREDGEQEHVVLQEAHFMAALNHIQDDYMQRIQNG